MIYGKNVLNNYMEIINILGKNNMLSNIMRTNLKINSQTTKLTQIKTILYKKIRESKNIDGRSFQKYINLVAGLKNKEENRRKLMDIYDVIVEIDKGENKSTYNKLSEVKAKKKTAATKLQNMFNNAVLLKPTKKETAFNDKVIDVVIQPKIIGSVAATDLYTIIMKSFLTARKQIPKDVKFSFYSNIRFTSNKGGDDFGAASGSFENTQTALWLSKFMHQITELVQSDELIYLKTF